MNSQEQSLWDEAIHAHDRKVLLSVMALGLPPDRARDVAQSAWTKLMEKHASGGLAEISLPGLVIRQARFLALNEIQRAAQAEGALRSVPEQLSPSGPDEVVIGRQELKIAIATLSKCAPMARKIFRLAYVSNMNHKLVAQEVGLSLQRVRQSLSETRQRIRIATAEEN